MKELSSTIEAHYNSPDLFERIMANLDAQGIDLENLGRSHISAVDEFHVRGAEVSRELAEGIGLKNKRVLDVGCGIGGPCRMLAEEFGCITTGIDLSREYIATAQRLSKLVGLEDKTTFIHGNALNLPFADKSFDLVWTQHVQMNIADKPRFYSEIDRVLETGGNFLYYDIFKKGAGKINYPVPWASTSEISFLSETSRMETILENLGLNKIQVRDQTSAGIDFFEKLLNPPGFDNSKTWFTPFDGDNYQIETHKFTGCT